MKFLVDHNLPPSLAHALHALSEKFGYEVVPLREKFPTNTSDEEWIRSLSEEGNWTVISQDHFKKSELEKKAFRDCGLTIFCLAKQWSKEDYWAKAHNLIKWWPVILTQAELVSESAAFRVPWRYAKSGRLEQIKL